MCSKLSISLESRIEFVAIDIEAIANESLAGLLPEPEVKIGNLKDPAKIEEKRKEAKISQIEKMATRPETGMICSYAAYGQNIEEVVVIDEISYSEEILLITKLLHTIHSERHLVIVTHNGINFDLPYIYKRAMINSVDMNGFNNLRHWTQKYTFTPHFDTMQVWNNWSHDLSNCSLDYLGSLLLGEGKTERNYSEYISLIKSGQQEKIAMDNMCDAKITYRLFEKMNGYLYAKEYL